MNVFDAALDHVVDDVTLEESSVESAVAVGRSTHLVLLVQYDLAVVSQTRQHELLEEHDVLAVQAEMTVLFEELLGRLFRVLRGHYVPWNR